MWGWGVAHPVLDGGGIIQSQTGWYPIQSQMDGGVSWGTPLGRDLGLLWDGVPFLERTWAQCKYYGMEMGTLLKRTWDQCNYYGIEMGYLTRKDMSPVEVLWDGDGDGVTPLPPSGQSENITFHHPLDVSGNKNVYQHCVAPYLIQWFSWLDRYIAR